MLWLTNKQYLWSMLAWQRVRDGSVWENHSLLFFFPRGKVEYGWQPHRQQQKGPEVKKKQRHPDSNYGILAALQDLSSAVINVHTHTHTHTGFSLRSLGRPAQALWKPYKSPTGFRSSRWGLHWRCSVSVLFLSTCLKRDNYTTHAMLCYNDSALAKAQQPKSNP